MIKVLELAIRKQAYVVWLYVNVSMLARRCASMRGVRTCVAYGVTEWLSCMVHYLEQQVSLVLCSSQMTSVRQLYNESMIKEYRKEFMVFYHVFP